MATGMARGAAERGKRIAFGEGRRILWDRHSEIIFRGNPNIASPGSEGSPDLEWINFHKGHRGYVRSAGNHWKWSRTFRLKPGQFFFSEQEIEFASNVGSGFIVIEPNIPSKIGAPNKQWPKDRYALLAQRLISAGHRVVQFSYGASQIGGVEQIRVPSFRYAASVLERASLYVGPEGGLHHAAAAVGRPAVVFFGAWIPPQVTGYDIHTNLAVGEACGALFDCLHCRQAMQSISVDRVFEAARTYL